MTPVLGSETWTAYLDLTNQVKPWLQFNGLSLDSDDTFILQLIVDAICAQAQQFLGRPLPVTEFGPATGLGKFDGSASLNSGYILLPRAPVIKVVSVVEYQGNKGVVLTEVPPTAALPPGSTGFQVNYRTGRLTRVLGGIWNRPFYPGSNNVWVTWTAGYNPIPANIILATLEWVAHVYRNTQQILGSGPREGAGEYEAATTAAGLWAGMPDRVRIALESLGIRIGLR